MHRGSLSHRFVLCLAVCLCAFLLVDAGVAFAAADEVVSSTVDPSLAVGCVGASGATGIYSWLAARERVLRKEHTEALAALEAAHNKDTEELGKRQARTRYELEARIKDLDNRVARVEEAAKFQPTQANITELIRALGELTAKVSAQNEAIQGMRSELDSLSRRFNGYETKMLEARVAPALREGGR